MNPPTAVGEGVPGGAELPGWGGRRSVQGQSPSRLYVAMPHASLAIFEGGGSMVDLELRCTTAEERQRYFEQLCAMDEAAFQELWKNSEVYAKLQKFQERLQGD